MGIPCAELHRHGVGGKKDDEVGSLERENGPAESPGEVEMHFQGSQGR